MLTYVCIFTNYIVLGCHDVLWEAEETWTDKAAISEDVQKEEESESEDWARGRRWGGRQWWWKGKGSFLRGKATLSKTKSNMYKDKGR